MSKNTRKEELQRRLTAAEWVLRVAVAAEFFGHGTYALLGRQKWLEWFPVFGVPQPEPARTLMYCIGALDWTLAVLVLVMPIPALLLWMAFWGFLTALVRYIVGEGILEFIERGANWGAPFALLILRGIPRNLRGWFSPLIRSS